MRNAVADRDFETRRREFSKRKKGVRSSFGATFSSGSKKEEEREGR